MRLYRLIKALPYPLLLLFAVFVSVPPASLTFADWPWEVTRQEGIARGAFIAFIYWVGPLLLCLSLLKRSIMVVPLFLGEASGLLLHTLLSAHAQSTEMTIVRLAILGTLLWFSFLLMNRDVLFPFLLGDKSRGWRLSPRLSFNVPLQLWYRDDSTSKVTVWLRDCSLTGLGLSGGKEELGDFLLYKDQLRNFIIHIGRDGKEWMLNVTLIQFRVIDDQIHVGLRVVNHEVMATFIEGMEFAPNAGSLGRWLAAYWVKSGFRHLALAAWAISLGVVLIVPSCSHFPSRLAASIRTASPTATTPIPAADMTDALPENE